jgi:large subunit ribosomal protein L18
MIKKTYANQARLRRHQRVRTKVSGTASRPRLAVFRSSNQIYAQIIDDERRVTLVAASSRESAETPTAKSGRSGGRAASKAEPRAETTAAAKPAGKAEARGEPRGKDAGKTAAAVAAAPDGDSGEATEDQLAGIAENRRVVQARYVGHLIAERAKAAGIECVVFDRGGYIYHGRVAALATGAREGGLDF